MSNRRPTSASVATSGNEKVAGEPGAEDVAAFFLEGELGSGETTTEKASVGFRSRRLPHTDDSPRLTPSIATTTLPVEGATYFPDALRDCVFYVAVCI